MSITDDERRLQRLGGELVDREVMCRQNAAVEAFRVALRAECGFFEEECENYWQAKCPECGELLPYEAYAAPEGSEYCYGCPHCSHEFDDADSEPAEVFEWWAITEWLATKLRERGEVLYESPDCWIWGRQTTGQAILLDGVIRDIASTVYAPKGES